jgi:acetylcholinesterase
MVQTQHATAVGTSAGGVDSFKGIPFAQAPIGHLRLKPPQPIVASLGTIDATGVPRACPQFLTATNTSSLLADTPAIQAATDSGEDCLTLNVQRPSTATAGSNLPALFWIYGVGFEFGSTQTYDATQLILNSLSQGKEIIYVAVNYRLGGFGFLPGKEIKAGHSANLGLLDQRLGLQWVADNIYNFGGDASKVTIWGESAGSISVFDQMALYNGNNMYDGKPFFRAAIMDSGSIVPADPLDCAKSQVVYNTVVQNARCVAAEDTVTG